MGIPNLHEGAFRRAWAATERFRQSWVFFWGLAVMGSVVPGVIGTWLGFKYTPETATRLQEFLNPTLGGAFGFIGSLLAVYLVIYSWNLFRAPYRQRDEARAALLRYEQVLDIEVRRVFTLPPESESEFATIGVEITLRPLQDFQWADAWLVLPDGTEGSTFSTTPPLQAGRDIDHSLTFAVSVVEYAPLPDQGRLHIRAGARDWYTPKFTIPGWTLTP